MSPALVRGDRECRGARRAVHVGPARARGAAGRAGHCGRSSRAHVDDAAALGRDVDGLVMRGPARSRGTWSSTRPPPTGMSMRPGSDDAPRLRIEISPDERCPRRRVVIERETRPRRPGRRAGTGCGEAAAARAIAATIHSTQPKPTPATSAADHGEWPSTSRRASLMSRPLHAGRRRPTRVPRRTPTRRRPRRRAAARSATLLVHACGCPSPPVRLRRVIRVGVLIPPRSAGRGTSSRIWPMTACGRDAVELGLGLEDEAVAEHRDGERLHVVGGDERAAVGAAQAASVRRASGAAHADAEAHLGGPSGWRRRCA